MIAFLIWLTVLIGSLIYLAYLIIRLIKISIQIRKYRKASSEAEKDVAQALIAYKQKKDGADK